MASDIFDPMSYNLVSNEGLTRDLFVESRKLIDLCHQTEIEISDSIACQLIAYLDMVLKKNEVLNLTSIREWDKALVLHLVDSLSFLDEFNQQPRGIKDKNFLDMGCGAGFPGIPLAIACPERHGMLCDSVRKKITAVEGFINLLHLDSRLSTSTDRLEILGTNHRRSFGCIVARAVAALPVLIEYAAPLLAKQGYLIVSKGIPSFEELQSGYQTAEICGLETISQRVLELPEEYGQRMIIVYRKAGEPEIPLPRPIGAATKEPLA